MGWVLFPFSATAGYRRVVGGSQRTIVLAFCGVLLHPTGTEFVQVTAKLSIMDYNLL